MHDEQSRVSSPPLVTIVHADDCGLSAGITDAIIRCYDHGWLRRTSVIVNGAGWAHALSELRRRPGLSVALHLNLFEGRPLSKPADVDLLVDRRGTFNRGFAALWLAGLRPGGARLRRQVRLEMRRQIDRFLEGLPDRGAMIVDGHVHYHVVPAVFNELMELCAEYPIGTVRLPREPLYWPGRGPSRPPLVNVAKNIVLQALSVRARPALRARRLQSADAFIGVLGTGAMTLEHVRAGLDRLRSGRRGGTVEILFHPGRARADEAVLWAERPDLQKFYRSENRDREAELLCSDAFGEVLARVQGTRESCTRTPVRSAEVVR
jgi:chitin disaccharide deacetylase